MDEKRPPKKAAFFEVIVRPATGHPLSQRDPRAVRDDARAVRAQKLFARLN